VEQIEETILRFRLEATRDAQKMSRLAFLVSTIISLAIIIATWNAYFSWYTDFTIKENWPISEVTEEVHHQIITQWVEGQTISIPILGIKVGMSDGSVFGSIGLLIISIWFFLSIRRENHVIGFLLMDTKEMPPKTRKWIYQGIASYTVFANVSRRNKPIKNLYDQDDMRQRDTLMRLTFKALVFFPPISIGFLIISDILTIFILPAYYRFPHTPLFEHLGFGDAVKLTVMEAFAFILLIIILSICTRTLSYVKCTTTILREYFREYEMEKQVG
jgi:hypothetical protein